MDSQGRQQRAELLGEHLPVALDMMTAGTTSGERRSLVLLSEKMAMTEKNSLALALHFAVGALLYVNIGGRIIFQDPKDKSE